MLTENDFKWYCPVPEISDWLCKAIPPSARVLDIGPGLYPFTRADVFVDITDRFEEVPKDKLVICDVAKYDLPFADKSFDFIYCRQVLEDLFDPFHLCREMSRVGKAGYIETPSPLVELCVGIDGSSPVYRGYHHHRYVVWAEADKQQLSFVTKYPIIEYLTINGDFLAEHLRSGARYWNTYYPWKDKIKFKHYENGSDFDFWKDYVGLLNTSINQSKAATDTITTKLVNNQTKVA